MAIESARFSWRDYSMYGIDFHLTRSLEKQDRITDSIRRESSGASGGSLYIAVIWSPVQSLETQDNDLDLEEMAGLDATKRVVVKRRLRDFQNSSRAQRRKIPETVADAAGIAAELLGNAVVVPS